MSTDKVGNDGPVKRVLLDLTYTETDLYTLAKALDYIDAKRSAAPFENIEHVFFDRVRQRIHETLRQHFPKKKLPIIGTK